MPALQPIEELEAFYGRPDPWEYERSADDARRRTELLSLLPARDPKRTLDIGCGDGFVTFGLPGAQVVGVDISAAAIAWALKARSSRRDAKRFEFRQGSVFELSARELGTFELVVITGVLYPQYIGKGFSVVSQLVDELLVDAGVLVSCHIDEWQPPRFPYTTLDTVVYPYRGLTHRLEVCLK
jgi:SAM-dependent methyltransferase